MQNLKYFTSLFFLFILLADFITAQTIRPIRDSIGYCWNNSEMDSFIKYLSDNQNEGFVDSAYNLVAGISPHDDYLYAGRVYFPLYRLFP